MSEPAASSPAAQNGDDDDKGFPAPFIRRRKLKPISYAEDDEKDELDEPPEPKRPRASKRKAKAMADSDDDEADGKLDLDDDDEESAKPKKRAAKRKSSTNRGKDADADTPAPTKRRRSKKVKTQSEDDGDGDAHTTDDDEADKPKPKKRRRKTADASAEGSDDSPKPKRRGRQKKAVNLPTAEDGEGRQSLDPTLATMADICADPGVGRLSSRYEAVVNAYTEDKVKRKKKRLEMHARAMKRLYGQPIEGEESTSVVKQLSLKVDESSSKKGDGDGGDDDEWDYEATVHVSGQHAVQIRQGDGNQTVVDESSLQVNREDDPEHRAYEEMEEIEESDLTKFVTSATYTRKVSGQRWKKEETELFFVGLQMFGSDFTSIALWMGTRPRSQIKQKFNREDKANSERVTWALKNRIPIDIETLSLKTGHSFDGPIPQYGPTKEQLKAAEDAETAARASSIGSSRKATREPSEAPSNASGKGRSKKRKSSMPEGMEVLGLAEDYVDKDDD
ncbi:hypothetical protein EXIGLDRAFT_831766 [Exidia glandulosa HHB12029]|uniref:Myb-like domain-containing protein n=1 Tax=Exidia glandulosa HHB12029 TaxID=1314781 RepID=A0A165MAB6_EXIGL|nr:hypothetical protein EXIGLDRAFT_831766 [Exidia glandulosa HHB12029]